MSLSDATKQAQGESTVNVQADRSGTTGKNWRAFLPVLVILFKLRIVFLLLMAATGGAFLAAEGWPGGEALALLWVTGGMAAAGASALNQYLEQKSDAKMTRTRAKRPLVTGDIPNPGWVPYVGSALVVAPSLVVFPFNPMLSFFLLLGAVIYVGIYTIWLKPRTLLNIVIGGAAGSAAVLSGSAAVGDWDDPGALVLAGLLFLWTPFHFWSLALLYRDDYKRAGVPMLPARTTPRRAAIWVMTHTIPTGIGGLLLASLPALGWLYFVPMLWITADLTRSNIRLIADPSPAHARALFMASNKYLLILLLAICIDSALPFLK